MSEADHERARKLLAAVALDDITVGERDWLDRHLADCTECSSEAGALSAAFAVTIDRLAPAAATISGFAPDSGTVGDGLTSGNAAHAITLSGAAEANSIVRVLDEAMCGHPTGVNSRGGRQTHARPAGAAVMIRRTT